MPTNTVLAKMAVQIAANTAQFNAAMSQSTKSMSAFQNTVLTTAKTLVGGFGVYQAYAAIRSGISIIADFERQMGKVRAITGATGEEFASLEKNALDLGRSTEYTARQIAGLQVEYGRLGFSTKEILNSTKATLNLATATGEDLARSAEIAGSTLRGFALDASEMGRVTDVITGALNNSALTLSYFADAIKYVSPVAKATNVSLEETSAILSVLADAGIKGSQAGTSLRRIMTELSKSGKPLSERLRELSERGVTLAAANDEVGLYAQTALLVLGRQINTIDKLTEEYKNLNGETQRTADIIRDDLTGDFDKLTSAIEGLILEGTALDKFFRSLTQSATNVVNIFAGVKDAAQEYRGALLAFRTDGTFRDRVFGRDLQGDLEVLRRLRQEAGLLEGAFSPTARKDEVPLADFFAKKAVEEAEARKLAREEQEKLLDLRRQQFEVERAIFNLQLQALKEQDLPEIDTEGAKNRVKGSPYLSGKLGALVDEDTAAVVAANAQAYSQAFDTIVDSTNRMTEAQLKDKKATEDRLNAYAQLASQVSDTIAAGIAGEKNFEQVLAGTTATIIDNLERQALANIIAKAAISGKNPVAAIVGATIGFAAIKGLFAKISRGGSSGSSGGASTASSVDTRVATAIPGVQSSSPVLETMVRGQDLYVVLKNYEQNKNYTHG